MSKVTVALLKASDPILKEGPRGYSPISVQERLRMMKAWQEETDGKSTSPQYWDSGFANLSEAEALAPPQFVPGLGRLKSQR